jgi:putative addiction module antidote
MIQQTIQIGNSVGIIIPKNVLEEKKIKIGDKIQVDVKPIKKSVSSVDTKFAKMVDEFIEEHKDVLEQLAYR